MYLSQNSPLCLRGEQLIARLSMITQKVERSKAQVNLRIPFTPKSYSEAPSCSERSAQAFSNSSSSRSSSSSMSSSADTLASAA